MTARLLWNTTKVTQASYGILLRPRWSLLSAKFHYRLLGVGYLGLQSAIVTIALEWKANSCYSEKSEFADALLYKCILRNFLFWSDISSFGGREGAEA